MKYPKGELIFGVVLGGIISVVMEVLIFALILKGMRDVAFTGEFLPWIDQVFIAAWGMIFLMGLGLYGFSVHNLRKGESDGPIRGQSDGDNSGVD